jgi:hypothetical protein
MKWIHNLCLVSLVCVAHGSRGTEILLFCFAMAKEVIKTPIAIAKISVAIAKLLSCYRLKTLTVIAKASRLK